MIRYDTIVEFNVD